MSVVSLDANGINLQNAPENFLPTEMLLGWEMRFLLVRMQWTWCACVGAWICLASKCQLFRDEWMSKLTLYANDAFSREFGEQIWKRFSRFREWVCENLLAVVETTFLSRVHRPSVFQRVLNKVQVACDFIGSKDCWWRRHFRRVVHVIYMINAHMLTWLQQHD